MGARDTEPDTHLERRFGNAEPTAPTPLFAVRSSLFAPDEESNVESESETPVESQTPAFGDPQGVLGDTSGRHPGNAHPGGPAPIGTH